VTVRATHVYRREDGEWKVVHRHANNPGHDPRSKEEEDD
jgi:ketosteroid isomerase-like protein